MPYAYFSDVWRTSEAELIKFSMWLSRFWYFIFHWSVCKSCTLGPYRDIILPWYYVLPYIGIHYISLERSSLVPERRPSREIACSVMKAGIDTRIHNYRCYISKRSLTHSLTRNYYELDRWINIIPDDTLDPVIARSSPGHHQLWYCLP